MEEMVLTMQEHNSSKEHRKRTDGTWPSELIELLRQQRTLVNELVARATQQESMIKDGRTDALVGLLSQRQEIIDSFSTTQEDFTSLLTNLDDRLDGATSDERVQIKSLVEEIGDSLGVVMRRDEEDRERLETSCHRVKQEMKDLAGSRKAHEAYSNAGDEEDKQKFADQCG